MYIKYIHRGDIKTEERQKVAEILYIRHMTATYMYSSWHVVSYVIRCRKSYRWPRC